MTDTHAPTSRPSLTLETARRQRDNRKVRKVKASTIEIRTEGAAKRLGKPRGKYITIDVGKIWLASDPDFEKAVDVTADKLAQLSCELCGHLPERVLIAGLGNRNITADALGDKTVGLLTVTRHIKLHSKSCSRCSAAVKFPR